MQMPFGHLHTDILQEPQIQGEPRCCLSRTVCLTLFQSVVHPMLGQKFWESFWTFLTLLADIQPKAY